MIFVTTDMNIELKMLYYKTTTSCAYFFNSIVFRYHVEQQRKSHVFSIIRPRPLMCETLQNQIYNTVGKNDHCATDLLQINEYLG